MGKYSEKKGIELILDKYKYIKPIIEMFEVYEKYLVRGYDRNLYSDILDIRSIYKGFISELELDERKLFYIKYGSFEVFSARYIYGQMGVSSTKYYSLYKSILDKAEVYFKFCHCLNVSD